MKVALYACVVFVVSLASGQTGSRFAVPVTIARIMYCDDPPIGISGRIYSVAEVARWYGATCELEHVPVLMAPLPDRIQEAPTFDEYGAEELPYDTVDCDNADGNPSLCTVEPDEP